MNNFQEDNFQTLKKEIRGLLISSPTGLNSSSFVKEYKNHIGKKLSFKEFGFDSIYTFLENIPDIVKYDRSNDMLIPVNPTKSKHISSLVSRQKTGSGRRIRGSFRRRTIEADLHEPRPIRRPVQLPIESSFQAGYHHGNHTDEIYSPESRPVNGFRTNERTVEEFFKYHSDDHYEEPDHSYEEVVIEGKPFDYLTRNDISPHSGSQDDLDIISEKKKENLMRLVQDYPDGLISSKLFSKYKEKYGYDLESPYQYINELVLALPTVFRYEHMKPGNDWLLFSAEQQIHEDNCGWVAKPLMDNMYFLSLDFPDGIRCEDIPGFYRDKFGQTLMLEHLNFDSIDSLVKVCKTVKYVMKGLEGWMYPPDPPVVNPGSTSNIYPVLPALSEISFLWKAKFRDNECDPTDNYEPFPIPAKENLKFKKVYVCDFITPNQFWLQFDEQVDELEMLMYRIDEFYNSQDFLYTLESSCIVEGLMCAVKFSIDNRWHRAKILSIDPSKVKVQYVDYGTVGLVDATSLRKLVKEFSKLPIQAVQATLHNLIPAKHSDWQSGDIDFIYPLLYDKKFLMQVLKINNFEPTLEIVLHTEDSTINDLLLCKGIAVHKGFVNTAPICSSNSEISAFDNNFPSCFSSPASKIGENSALDDRPRVGTPPGYPSKTSIPHSSFSSACSCLKSIANILHEHPSNFKQMSDILLAVSEKVQELAVEINNIASEEDVGNDKFIRRKEPVSTETHIPSLLSTPLYRPPSKEPSHFSDHHSKAPVLPHFNATKQGPPLMQGVNMMRPSLIPNMHRMMPMQQGNLPIPWDPSQQGLSYPAPRHQHPFMNFQNQVNFSNPHTSISSPYQFPHPRGSVMFPGNSQLPVPVIPQAAFSASHAQSSGQFPPGFHQTQQFPCSNFTQVQPQSASMYDVRPEHPQILSQVSSSAASDAPHKSVHPQISSPAVTKSSQTSSVKNYHISPNVSSSTPRSSETQFQESSQVPHSVPNSCSNNFQHINIKSMGKDECSRVQSTEVEASSCSRLSTSDNPVYHSLNSSRSTTPSLVSSASPQLVSSPTDLEPALKTYPVSHNFEENINPKPSNQPQITATTCKDVDKDHCVNKNAHSDPTTKLLEFLMEKTDRETSSNESLASESNEYKMLDAAITKRICSDNEEPVNSLMKIFVQGPYSHKTYTIHLLLVKDNVAVLLTQLLKNYSDLDLKSFSEKYGHSDLGVYSIFYTEHTFLFSSLRNEGLISEDDINIQVVNLLDITTLLQCISTVSYGDLQNVCDIFKEVYNDVPVDSEYWWVKKD